ncbi:MAG TPA: caspase family protein [Opitutaceae bacterium]
MTYQRHALLLGINEYRDPEISPLAGAKADALAMYVFLLTELRFDRAQLVEPEHAGQFLDLVEKSANELGPQDLLVVYYAGHGFEVNHKHFLLTPSDRISRLKADLGTMHKEALVHAMRGNGCHRMLITDSCRSALQGSRGGPLPRGHNAVDRDLGIKEAKEAQGSLTLFNACDEGKTAAEVKQLNSGLFTRALLQVWGQARAGGGIVTVDSAVQQQVAARMRETAAQFGVDGDQYPWLMSSGWAPPLGEGAAQGVRPPPVPMAAAPMPPPAPAPAPAPAQPQRPNRLAPQWRWPDVHPKDGPARVLVVAILILVFLNWLFHGHHPIWMPWHHRM